MAAYTPRFGEALIFADELHRRQRRKTTGVPYVTHLLGVASLVVDDWGTEDEAIAALLHDSLEDQGRHYPGGVPALAKEIERRFGAEVRRIVEACTERRTQEEGTFSTVQEMWRAHKHGYITQILAADASVRRVSCADSIHNVRSLTKEFIRTGDALWTKFKTKSAADQLWAYDVIAKAFLAIHAGPLELELDRAVAELHRIVGLERTGTLPPR